MAFVYFIQPECGGPIKIGKADDPEKRLKELQCGNPYRLVIRYTQEMADAYVAEAKLHKLFAKYRMVGEWFRPVPALAQIARAIPEEGDETLTYEDRTYEQNLWRRAWADTPAEFRHRYEEVWKRRQELYAEQKADAAIDKANLDDADRWNRAHPTITALPLDFGISEYMVGSTEHRRLLWEELHSNHGIAS